MEINVKKTPEVKLTTFYGFVQYEGSSREYLFKTFYTGLVPGDKVLTRTKRGLVIGTFIRYGEADPIATAYIIGIVDPLALEASRDGN